MFKLVGPHAEINLTDEEMRLLLMHGKIAVNREKVQSTALQGLGNAIDAFRTANNMGGVQSHLEVI
jgi:hypothetical protein